MNFQEHYAQLTDDELLVVAASRSELVPEATVAMDSEMGRRGLSYQDAHAKKRQMFRQEIKELNRGRRSRKGTKYFVYQMTGRWVLLSLSPCLLVILQGFTHVMPEEWLFPILIASLGCTIAISSVQPWLRQTPAFWLSLPVACIVQLILGHIINVRLAPQSRGELKGAAFLAILGGYLVGVPLFLLLQKVIPKKDPESDSV